MQIVNWIVLAVLTAGFHLESERSLRAQTPRSNRDPASLAELSDSFESLTARVSPAVVQITSSGYAPAGPDAASSGSLLALRRSTGSGVILDPDGYIVTNAHVIDGARRIQVSLAAPHDEGRSILRPKGRMLGAQVVGIDRETDLAVLKIEEKNLPFCRLGDSDLLRQGELVLAFGSPLGLENSVTLGIVSAVARQLREEDPMVYIQTDASINPGNSGGPLLNTGGMVVGINTFIFSQSGGNEGIGFAAPSNIVRNVYEQIRTHGRVRRGEIGVHAQTLTPTLAAGLKLSRYWGVVLGDVTPGGPSDRAGLRVGDLVQSLDGKIMENGRQFDVNLYSRRVGETVSLEVLRGEEKLKFEVTVVERPNDMGRIAELVTPERNLVAKLGILAVDLDRQVLSLLPILRKPSGVVVALQASGAGSSAGAFRPGDVIHAVNGSPVSNLAELRASLDELDLYDAVVVQVERLGRLMFIAFELE